LLPVVSPERVNGEVTEFWMGLFGSSSLEDCSENELKSLLFDVLNMERS